MEIKEVNDTFFENQSFVKIDDAYDLYKKKKYIEYVVNHKKNCIFSQDIDISFLNEMPFIQYLILPKEVEHIDVLYNLKELIGIKLYSSIYNRLDVSKLPSLKEVCLICDEKVNLLTLSNVTRLAIINYNGKMEFEDHKKLEYLEISNSKRLECLESLPKSLHCLVLDYCPSLKILNLGYLKLKELLIFDCNNIKDIERIILSQSELVSLKLFNKETFQKGTIHSLSILNDLKNLQSFVTDYKILDYDLKPLKRLLDVDILRWNKKYNLKDSELPHIYVTIKTDDFGYSGRKVLLSSLPETKNNPNIIWNDVLRLK